MMRENKKIDLTRLFGFETVSEQPCDGLDFQDETFAAKLGAKVGIDVPGGVTTESLDKTR